MLVNNVYFMTISRSSWSPTQDSMSSCYQGVKAIAIREPPIIFLLQNKYYLCILAVFFCVCSYMCTCVCLCVCACMHGHVCVLNCPLMWEVNRFNSHFVIITARHLTKYVASGSVLVNFLIVKSLLCRTMFFISTHIYFCYCTSLTINHHLI